jgi:phospholipid/cholesterol/gamma-HCH transport system ATP-binding protein
METASPPLIEIVDLHKSFGEKHVLRGVSFPILGNAVTTIIGKSGEGKSVLLKCIAGILKPSSGEIRFIGNGDGNGNGSHRSRKWNKPTTDDRLSYMFQNNALFDSLTAFDNVALPLRERTKMKPPEIRRRVTELFEKLDLHGIEKAFPADLSGGMQKRVALARALVFNPRIVLFDEPTTGLDPVRKNAVFTMIERYQEVFGYTAVLVSHDLPDALYFSDHVIMLRNGKVAFSGTPVELEQSEGGLADDFLHSREDLQDELLGLEGPAQFTKALPKLREEDATLAVILVENFERLRDDLGELAAYLLESSLVRFLRHVFKLGRGVGYSLGRGGFVLPHSAHEALEPDTWSEALTQFSQHLRTLNPSSQACVSVKLHFLPAAQAEADATALLETTASQGRTLLTHHC